MQLGQRLWLGRRRHPGQTFYVLVHRRLDFFHHLQRFLLGLGTKIFLHIGLAKRFAQIAIDRFRAAFPARLQFLLSTQDLSVECEIFIQKRSSQEVGVGMHQMPPQISFPVSQILLFQYLAQRFEEGWRGDV